MKIEEEREQYMRQLRQWTATVQRHHLMLFVTWYRYTFDLAQADSQPTDPNVQFYPAQNLQLNVAAPIAPGLYEFRLPPMWKRLIAEMIDFGILTIIKMALTLLVMELFDMDLGNYSIIWISEHFKQPRLNVSAQVLLLEILYRVIVCTYETYFLTSNDCATPGKRYMGLVVIQAENTGYVWGREQPTVITYPGTRLNLKNAIIRASLKNLFIGLVVPICCTLLFSRFTKTGYDYLSNSQVVEYDPNPVDHN